MNSEGKEGIAKIFQNKARLIIKLGFNGGCSGDKTNTVLTVLSSPVFWRSPGVYPRWLARHVVYPAWRKVGTASQWSMA